MFNGNSPLTGHVVSPLTRNITPNQTNGGTGFGTFITTGGTEYFQFSVVLAGAGKGSFYFYADGPTVNSLITVSVDVGGLEQPIDQFTWIGGEPTTGQWYNVTGTLFIVSLTMGMGQSVGTEIYGSLHVMSI